ncbi:DUF4915 domain-containing protein [Thermodesulfobacteriota bacterium]
MNFHTDKDQDALWSEHDGKWRNPLHVIGLWDDDNIPDKELLQYVVSGSWREILAQCGIVLLVTREYEHLVMAISPAVRGTGISYLRMPHPSGVVIDRKAQRVYIASTRNPNMIYDLEPSSGLVRRKDIKPDMPPGRPLVPIKARFYPGCLYIHDLALISGQLYANAVGQNAVVHLSADGGHERVWWPSCIESKKGPVFGQNHIQLNSIATGTEIEKCYFSASTDRVSSRRPGHKNFQVDKTGVVFSGATRDPVVRGLTRPHSARLYNKKIWIANSGYGEFGYADNGKFRPITKLPGWTRGLCIYKNIAFIGTSRVIPRFSQYAPGLEVNTSLCGIHAIDMKSGKSLGSITWPYGNQIFAIDWISIKSTSGFSSVVGTRSATTRQKKLFYAFKTNSMRNLSNEK